LTSKPNPTEKKNNCKITRIQNKKQKQMGIQIMTIDQERIKDRKEQKEFFDKLNNMLDNFPNKNMFKKKDTHNETDPKT
jgi:hypothetical protein